MPIDGSGTTVIASLLALGGVLVRMFTRWLKGRRLVAPPTNPAPEVDQGPVGIVFIDDSATDLTLIRKAVEKLVLPLRLKFIRTGQEAREFLLKNDQPWITAYVRLIVLDVLMPDVVGLELLHGIRERQDLRKVPVVVFTGSLNRLKMEEVYAAGANSLVLKTGNFQTFEKKVTDICHYWLAVNESESY